MMLILHQVPPVPEPRVQSEGLEDDQEEGESMDVVNQDDEAMMAMMGIAGFGTTKVRVFPMGACRYLKNPSQGKHVDGNQEGAAKVKKVRTWRQYMNRFVVFSDSLGSHAHHMNTLQSWWI